MNGAGLAERVDSGRIFAIQNGRIEGRSFAERGVIDCLLVARLYVDLRRVASAACPVV